MRTDGPKRWLSDVTRPYAVLSRDDTAGESALFLFVEICLQLFFSWTLAYHLCIALQLPAQRIIIPFGIILALLLWRSVPRWRHALGDGIGAPWFVAGALLLGVGLGIFTLVVSRPDADDVQYFHRALVQLRHLDRPFILSDTIHNVPGLPLTSAITITSYEFFVAMAANAFGIDPLFAFHNLAPFVVAVAVIAVYVLLYRFFGLQRTLAVVATLLLCIFLILDGNVHRSFGSVSIVRLWQGKAIMWSLLVPLSLLTTCRYMERPGPARFVMVLTTAVAAPGLSSSGLFLIPAMIFSASLAFLLNHGPTWAHLRRAMVVNLASVYSGCILTAMFLDWWPTYAFDEFFSMWPGSWWANLGLVVDTKLTLVRNLVLLVPVPALLLPRPHNRFLPILTGVLVGLFTNPVTGPFFMELLRGGAYWRLAYLFPVPLCAGLLASVVTKPMSRSIRSWQGLAVGSLAVVTVLLAYENSVLTPKLASRVSLKHPLSYRFPRAEYDFCSRVAGTLDHRNLLAPERIIHILPLLNPTIRVETARQFQTWFNFKSVGNEAEAFRRLDSQTLVTNCERADEMGGAFLQSIEGGVDAVVIGRCSTKGRDALIALLESTDDSWVKVDERHGYMLLIRE